MSDNLFKAELRDAARYNEIPEQREEESIAWEEEFDNVDPNPYPQEPWDDGWDLDPVDMYGEDGYFGFDY